MAQVGVNNYAFLLLLNPQTIFFGHCPSYDSFFDFSVSDAYNMSREIPTFHVCKEVNSYVSKYVCG